VLQTVYRETLPILKDIFLTLTLWQRPLKIYVSVVNITNEFILGLDILRAYGASVDLGDKCCVLQRKSYRYEEPGRDPTFQPGSDQRSDDVPVLHYSTVNNLSE
jgi:hypothetical protein